MDWLDNLINTAGSVYTAKYAAAQAPASATTQPQLGQAGYYVEGQPGVSQTPKTGITVTSTTLLIIGGVVLAVVLLKN